MVAQENGSTAAKATAGSAVVAVGSVKDGLLGTSSLSVSVPSSTRAVGVIQPPPDIRSIVDKTAQFVARNGQEFEKRILGNEKDNVKFNFLKPSDPYHAYYRLRVKDFQEGDGKPADAAKAKDAQQDESLAKKEVIVISSLEKPDDDMFTVDIPQGLSALDLDVIKLTAQFVALNGKSFLTGLMSREHMNPLFRFLKPQHSLFPLFLELQEAYTRILKPPKEMLNKLADEMSTVSGMLERCLKRVEWNRQEEENRKREEDATQKERMAMQMIDWHEFSVVETIDFDEGQDYMLPRSATHSELKQKYGNEFIFVKNEYQQRLTLWEALFRLKFERSQRAKDNAQAGQPNEAAGYKGFEANGQHTGEEMDATEARMVAEARATMAPQPSQPQIPVSMPSAHDNIGEDMDEDVEIPPEPVIKVVRDYKRPEERRVQAMDAMAYAISPITGEKIPVDKMAEHIRISLIDPKWKEQKEAMLSKVRETVKADDDEITKNLMSLATRRPDIFSSTDEEVSTVMANEMNKELVPQAHAIWDGSKGSISHIKHAASKFGTHSDIAAEHKTEQETNRVFAGPTSARQNPPSIRQLPPNLSAPVPSQAMPPATGVQGPVGQMHPSRMQAISGTGHTPSIQQLPMDTQPPVIVTVKSKQDAPTSEADEPLAKRPRVDPGTGLQTEEYFLQENPGPVELNIIVPSINNNDILNGQTLRFTFDSAASLIGEVKGKVAGMLGFPDNKCQLNFQPLGFLKDHLSLAHYNVSSGSNVNLRVRVRGGKK